MCLAFDTQSSARQGMCFKLSKGSGTFWTCNLGAYLSTACPSVPRLESGQGRGANGSSPLHWGRYYAGTAGSVLPPTRPREQHSERPQDPARAGLRSTPQLDSVGWGQHGLWLPWQPLPQHAASQWVQLRWPGRELPEAQLSQEPHRPQEPEAAQNRDTSRRTWRTSVLLPSHGYFPFKTLKLQHSLNDSDCTVATCLYTDGTAFWQELLQQVSFRDVVVCYPGDCFTEMTPPVICRSHCTSAEVFIFHS